MTASTDTTVHTSAGPIEAHATIVVAMAPPEVFARFVDFRLHPQWVKNLSKVTLVTGEPIAVGSRFKAAEGPPPVGALRQLKMMAHFMNGLLTGSKSYSVATITAIEAPTRIAWSAGIPKGDGYFNAVDWDVTFSADGAGTAIVQRSWWRPQVAAARRMVAAAGPGGLDAAIASNLAAFKAHLESVADAH